MNLLKTLPIRIDPLFWVLAFGLGFYYSGTFPGAMIWAAIVLISVLFHELGHALTAQFFGQAASITLTFFGGVTKREGPSISKWKEFIIVLNGPLAGLFLAYFALWLSNFSLIKQYPILLSAFRNTYFVNLFWTFINLFPIQPLDGGHLLMILFQGLFGYRGIKIAYFLSGVLAALFGFFFFYIQQVFIGSVFLIFAFDSFRGWKSSLIMSQADHNEDLQGQIKNAEQAIAVGNIADAKAKLHVILKNNQAQGGLLVLKAAELLAKILYEEGNVEEAYSYLSPYRKYLDIDGLKLLQHIAFKSQHIKETLDLGVQIHQEMASSDTALLNAFASAELKDPKSTLGWLKTAIDEGLPNRQMILQSARFDFLKSNSEFQNLLK